MQQVIPAFRITNYTRSKMFYKRMGFQVDWEHRFEPHFPVFAQISKDKMAIYLTEHTEDCQVGGLIHFFVPNVDNWYSELNNTKDVHIEPPNEDLEGLRMITVVDPDGNQLRICTRL